MFAYLWPIGLVVIAELIYQVCAKEVPSEMNAFASLMISYTVAAIVTVICFFVFGGSGLFAEFAKANWATVALGISVVGLEVGFVFAFKKGWEVSLAFIVQAAAMSVILLFLGLFLYNEGLSWNKLAGVAVCLAGLVMINRK